MITLEAGDGGLRLVTPYDAAFVTAFKQLVPHAARSWQKPAWIIAPEYGAQVADLVETFFNRKLAVPAPVAPGVAETRMLSLRYLGRCKPRDGGESSAYGTLDGQTWTLVFPEAVLRAWFGAQQARSDSPPTLYAVLGISQTVDADALKQAYRRMARQWHPDVCREEDAAAQFRRIQQAYDVLRDAKRRKKYDAGLALEAQTASMRRGMTHWDNAASQQYRAPLRCGLVLAEGRARVGRFHVTRILDWQDIVDARGRTMVSSWNRDAECVYVEWI